MLSIHFGYVWLPKATIGSQKIWEKILGKENKEEKLKERKSKK